MISYRHNATPEPHECSVPGASPTVLHLLRNISTNHLLIPTFSTMRVDPSNLRLRNVPPPFLMDLMQLWPAPHHRNEKPLSDTSKQVAKTIASRLFWLV